MLECRWGLPHDIPAKEEVEGEGAHGATELIVVTGHRAVFQLVETVRFAVGPPNNSSQECMSQRRRSGSASSPHPR